MSFYGTRKPVWPRYTGAIDYDDYWRARGFILNTYLKEREELMLARIKRGARVLDLGCGNSLLPKRLLEKKCSITVGDISEVVLSGYRALGIGTLHVDLDRIGESTFAQYDIIIMSEVLEHTRNPEEIIATLRGHTKQFYVTIPNSAYYRYRFHLLFRGRFFTQWVHHPSEHLRYWSHVDFLEWLTAQGLTVEESVASNGFSVGGLLPPLKNWWKNLLAHQVLYVCTTS